MCAKPVRMALMRIALPSVRGRPAWCSGVLGNLVATGAGQSCQCCAVLAALIGHVDRAFGGRRSRLDQQAEWMAGWVGKDEEGLLAVV